MEWQIYAAHPFGADRVHMQAISCNLLILLTWQRYSKQLFTKFAIPSSFIIIQQQPFTHLSMSKPSRNRHKITCLYCSSPHPLSQCKSCYFTTAEALSASLSSLVSSFKPN